MGSPVKFRGVTLGRVLEINAAPDQRHVEVIAAIYEDRLKQLGLPSTRELRREGEFAQKDLRVQLDRSLLTGVTVIQGDFFDPEKYPIPDYGFEVPYNTVHSVPTTLKSVEEALKDTIDQLPELVGKATDVLARLDQGVQDLALDELSARARSVLDAADARLRALDSLEVFQQATATMEEAERALLEIRGLATDLRSEDGELMQLVAHVEGMARELEEELGETRLADTTRAVRELGASASGTADELALVARDVRAELAAIHEMVDSVRSVFEMLERDPGSLLYGKTSPSVFDRSDP